jgi:5-methylcytosine-specific restriction enzyme subunit McrC
MLPGKVIQVFEYGKLRVEEQGLFQQKHFERLVRYNEAHGNKYFRVGHNSIYFESYVGVIQVGDLVIEVLPKADRDGMEDKNKWHVALLRMLHVCRKLRLESLTDAQLKLRSTSLLDLYFHSYLEEVEYLVHCGLTKKYRKQQGNVGSLKGRWLFQQQISQNLVHQERFFTEHTIYDRNHPLNRILKKALEVLASISSRTSITARTKRLLLDFESIDSCSPALKDFDRVPVNRKTEPYLKALLLAKMIILNYSPDFKGGKEHILAILFNMERLFEEYVTIVLRQAALEYSAYNIRIDAQQSRDFWQGKTIRPDIVATFRKPDSVAEEKVIIDAKWKVLTDAAPSDADLKQMFAYNLQFNSTESVLLYPKVYMESTGKMPFHKAGAAEHFTHHCRLYFAELVHENGALREDFGQRFIEEVLLRENAYKAS